MLLRLGEPRVRFLWCWLLLFFIHCCSSFIDVFAFPSYFSMPPALHPGFSGPWRFPPALNSIPWLLWIAFAFSSTASATVLSGHFYPQTFFTLRSFPNIFDSTYFYQRLPGSRQVFFQICRTSCGSSKYRPGLSICLIHSNRQSWFSEEFVFKSC